VVKVTLVKVNMKMMLLMLLMMLVLIKILDCHSSHCPTESGQAKSCQKSDCLFLSSPVLPRQVEMWGKHGTNFRPGEWTEGHLVHCWVCLEASPGFWRGAAGVEGIEKDPILEIISYSLFPRLSQPKILVTCRGETCILPLFCQQGRRTGVQNQFKTIQTCILPLFSSARPARMSPAKEPRRAGTPWVEREQ